MISSCSSNFSIKTCTFISFWNYAWNTKSCIFILIKYYLIILITDLSLTPILCWFDTHMNLSVCNVTAFCFQVWCFSLQYSGLKLWRLPYCDDGDPVSKKCLRINSGQWKCKMFICLKIKRILFVFHVSYEIGAIKVKLDFDLNSIPTFSNQGFYLFDGWCTWPEFTVQINFLHYVKKKLFKMFSFICWCVNYYTSELL